MLALCFAPSSGRIRSAMPSSRSVLPSPATASEIEAADLLARARRLDRNALALLHQTHYPEVYRYVGFRLPDEDACAKIAAQVFVHFLAALRKRRAPRQNLPGWLLREAGSLVDEYLRKTGRATAANTPPPPDHQGEGETKRSQFYTALLRLPTDQQHFLAMRFSQPRALSEVAQLMGRPEEQLRALQQRALATLQVHLGGQL